MANNPIIMSLIDAQAEDGFDAPKLKMELMQHVERNKLDYNEECAMIKELSRDGVLDFFEASALKEQAMQKLYKSVANCKRKYLLEGGDESYVNELVQMLYESIGLSRSLEEDYARGEEIVDDGMEIVPSEDEREATAPHTKEAQQPQVAQDPVARDADGSIEASNPDEEMSNLQDEDQSEARLTPSGSDKKSMGARVSGKDNGARDRRNSDGSTKKTPRAVSVKIEPSESEDCERNAKKEGADAPKVPLRSSQVKRRSQEKPAEASEPVVHEYEPPMLRHAAARSGVCPFLDRVVDEMVELSQRLPFSVMKTTSEEVWDNFEAKMSDLKMKPNFSSIKRELLWLLREIKEECLKESWFTRNHPVLMQKFEGCGDPQQLQELLLEFKCNAVSWKLVRKAMQMDSMSGGSSQGERKRIKVESCAGGEGRDRQDHAPPPSSNSKAETYKSSYRNVTQTSDGMFQPRIYITSSLRHKVQGKKKVYISEKFRSASKAAKRADQFLLEHFKVSQVLPYLNFPKAART